MFRFGIPSNVTFSGKPALFSPRIRLLFAERVTNTNPDDKSLNSQGSNACSCLDNIVKKFQNVLIRTSIVY